MKLVRPHIPITVKLEVIARQLQADRKLMAVLTVSALTMKNTDRLAYLLKAMFGDEKTNLDHDPPLALRYFDEVTGKYSPDACDPRHLIYRTRDDHIIKTRIRGDHGQFSDLALIRREKKRLKLKTRSTERQARQNPEQGGKVRSDKATSGVPRSDTAGPPAEADRSRDRLASVPSRWPPGRKLRSRPFLKVVR